MGGKAGALVTDDDATPVLVSGVPTPVSRAALTMLAVAVVCASVVFGFLDLFSNFREYDDEGYWLISTKLFLDGYVLYDQLSIPYGPVSLATKQFLHGALSIPVSNSAVRFVTLGYWILLSALSALLVLLTARSSTWGLVAFATVFIAMRAFTNEPGHPQDGLPRLY